MSECKSGAEMPEVAHADKRTLLAGVAHGKEVALAAAAENESAHFERLQVSSVLSSYAIHIILAYLVLGLNNAELLKKPIARVALESLKSRNSS